MPTASHTNQDPDLESFNRWSMPDTPAAPFTPGIAPAPGGLFDTEAVRNVEHPVVAGACMVFLWLGLSAFAPELILIMATPSYYAQVGDAPEVLLFHRQAGRPAWVQRHSPLAIAAVEE